MCNKNFVRICLFLWVIVFLQPGFVCAAAAKEQYFRAEACYYKLRKNPERQKYRHNWLTCIKKFQVVYTETPSGQWASAGMYMSAKLYLELYKRSYRRSDLHEAIDIFRRIIKRYPKSRYRTKASAALHTIEEKISQRRNSKRLRQAQKTKKKSDIARSQVRNKTKALANKTTTITGLRYWSNPSYTRVVIDANWKTSYTYRLLKKDPGINKPQRLYVDLNNSILGKGIRKFTPINDNLLRDARAGQYLPHVVRVVVDIKSIKNYNVFSLQHPFRVVLDMTGDAVDAENAARFRQKVTTTQLGRPLIVLDPGHGGRDLGSSGCVNGMHEKDVVLQITRKLAKMIRKQLHYEVIMTRNRDSYLTLEERTAIANTKNADLFISIHTNTSENQKRYGIETYFLNLAIEDEAINVAARENATSSKNISDLQTILADIMQNAKIDESGTLASYVQESLFNHMQSRYNQVKNKGIKQAPFYVLLGARMPAILIEASFISNPRECRRLASSTYQEHLCEGIIDGIKKFIKASTKTALYKPSK